ncbi:MAG: PQQ-binding-like beta-propeller repeat protein [Planctomycetes bacterium]|nr:PQQ-binding-like beta-propeller repeat protein [Planctomycetota bacterium]
MLIVLGVVVFQTVQRRFASDAKPAHDPHNAPASVTARQMSFEWPQWRGPNHDGVSRATNLLTSWPERGPNTLWKKATSGTGYSGLSIAAGRLYTLMQDGKDEAVVCLDAATGEELWRFRYAASFINDQGSGPRSTPTVDGDRVYTVGATGILHCLSSATGKKIWRRDLIKELDGRIPDWGVSFSPLVDGDLVFTHPGGSAGNSLAAFNKHTGELRWKSLDDRPGYGSPISMTTAGVRQILFFTGEALVSVAPENGRLYWRYPWLTMMDCNVATPICAGDHVFISSGYGHGCALLKIASKGSGALGVDLVYEHDQMRNHFSTSVLYEDHLYGFDETRLVCMELTTGNVLWRAKGFRKGSLVVADGHLIILGENGKLALAEATPAAYRKKASYRMSRNRCWTVPTLANGRLYVRDQEQITCLDLKTTQGKIADVNEKVAGRLLSAALSHRNNEK